MNKKAAIQLTAKWIVIVLIAIVVLLLLIMLVRKIFTKTSTEIEEALREAAPPPNAVISSPNPSNIYKIFEPLLFDGSESYDDYNKIAGYYWDFNSDFLIDSRSSTVEEYYYEPGEYNATLRVVNEMGKIDVDSITIRVYTRNTKIDALKDSLFLIRDNERANTNNILRLIPITTWNDMEGSHKLPFYVYYVKDPTNSLTQTQLKEIMEKYGKKHAYAFDDPNIPCCEFSWGNITKVSNIDDIYFDFWSFYEYVVLVDKSQYESALIASLFAAFYNSPIIFIDSSNLENYKEDIINKKLTTQVYYIPSVESIDPEVHQFITDNNIAYTPYPTEYLREGRVNRIIKLSSNVTMQP